MMKYTDSRPEYPRLHQAAVESKSHLSHRMAATKQRDQSESERRGRAVVVLLHGLFATRRSMRKLAACLGTEGYQVINWGYSTFWRSTEQHIEKLLVLIRTLQSDPEIGAIHFVTHSMGGILARGVLHFGSGQKVQRVVMLSPPNTGSKLTRFPLGPFAWCCPAIVDLSESPDSLPNRMHRIADAQIGIIAAEHDFVVPLPNTLLASQRDHFVISTTHVRILSHEEARLQVLYFLENGNFSHPSQHTRAA